MNFFYRELLIIGGASAKEQIDALSSGIDIVVGTPGRLEDLISTNKLELSACRFLFTKPFSFPGNINDFSDSLFLMRLMAYFLLAMVL